MNISGVLRCRNFRLRDVSTGTRCSATVLTLTFVSLACFSPSRVTHAADGNLGNGNTAEGSFALNAIATNSANTGHDNTAIGTSALEADTSGSFNTASSDNALASNTTGSNNTASGFDALFSNTTADNNTANGFKALLRNTTGTGNTASGYFALSSNTNGSSNTATGFNALSTNTSGMNNTSNGLQSLFANSTGDGNTASGFDALLNNISGSFNIAIGYLAGVNLTTGSNNIDIGNVGKAGEANTVRIGTQGTQKAAFIAGIYPTAVTGSTVVINASGKLGVAASSARFKESVKLMDKASEAILALKPVIFRYKGELDADKVPQFGLIAEDVEKIDPDLVARDEQGKAFTVRYEAVNAMLLNEFLKEHQKVEEQQATIAHLKREFDSKINGQQKQIEALTAGLQKVSAEIQVNKSVPQSVALDR